MTEIVVTTQSVQSSQLHIDHYIDHYALGLEGPVLRVIRCSCGWRVLFQKNTMPPEAWKRFTVLKVLDRHFHANTLVKGLQ